MFKNFSKREYILTTILILVIIFCGVSIFLLQQSYKSFYIEPKEIEVGSEEYGAGDIGEVGGENTPLSLVIFNTTGTIQEVKGNYLIARGDGTNFADKSPRTLKVIFTESTKTFKPGQKTYYQGLDGLGYLKPGMKISISGAENIRGKTEFQARTINVL